MNALITACLTTKDLQLLIDYPRTLANNFEIKVLDWIFAYTAEFGVCPTVRRLTATFPEFAPLYSDDPLHDIFYQTLLAAKRDTTSSYLFKVTENLRDESYDPQNDVRELAAKVGFDGSGFVKYSKFDRSEYFKPIRPLKFHFPIIDRVTGGLLNGDLCYMVGRLGTGKTTLAQWMVHNWWKDDKSIFFVSNEMMPLDVLIKFDAMVGHFNPLDLRLHREEKKLRDKIEVVSHMVGSSGGEITIPRRRLTTPQSILAAAAQLDVDAIVVDGVYLMHSVTKSNSKWERMADNSNALKQGALELGIPVLGISQLKRMGGKLEVDTEDIAYSDALAQDADTVIAIVPNEEDKSQISVELIKSRYGPAIGTTVKINFDTMTVVDVGAHSPM